MAQVDTSRRDEARELDSDDRLRLDQIEIDAVRGCEETRRAIMEGGHPALLQRAQLPDADILQAIMDRWTEEALVQFSTSSLTVLHDKSPRDFLSKGLGRVGSHLKWSADQLFSGLLATVKLCGLRLQRPCPPQWLVKPRTSAVLREGVELQEVLDEEPIHDGADAGSSVSSTSTCLGGDVDESWTVPEHILCALPLTLCVINTEEQAAEYLPSQAEGHPHTARHLRTPAELHRLSKTVKGVWRGIKFGTMGFEPLIKRVCAFSVEPDDKKELIRSTHKSYLLAVDMATRQINLFAAFAAQTELELGAGDPEDSEPFSLHTRTPEAWALFEATVAAIAHPP
jgi:hypothetical protein